MTNKCIICGKEHYLRPSDYKRGRRCCSRKCGYIRTKRYYGKNHSNWKGNEAGYSAIHNHMKRIFPKPQNCSLCNKKTSVLDLANISQEYKRIPSDYEYLCRKCHMEKDGRLKALLLNR